MALVGGALAAFLSDGVLSLGSIVGFYTVFGIAARNGILMISHFQHLERYEGETFGQALVLRGARERLSPILMTTLAAGLALVPLVVAGRIPGHEIEYPMAIVILGRPGHVDAPEPVRRAVAVPPLRTRALGGRGAGVTGGDDCSHAVLISKRHRSVMASSSAKREVVP